MPLRVSVNMTQTQKKASKPVALKINRAFSYELDTRITSEICL